MQKISLVLFASLALPLCAHAVESANLLFAVDISMTAQDRAAAIDVVSTLTNSSATTAITDDTSDVSVGGAIGLTLFDDTVRRFVALAPLSNSEQIIALNQALSDVPGSVRSTSNLAVGIERAIDDTLPESGGQLFVFSRGIIDTDTKDPRARFAEWLDVILLPQAREKSIAITLVLPPGSTADPEVGAAFSTAEPHQLVSWREAHKPPAALLALRGVQDRPYGDAPAHTSAEASATAGTSLASSPGTSPGVTLSGNSVASTNSAGKPMTLIRAGLLILAVALLIAIVLWRRKVLRRVSVGDETSRKNTTYLPLSAKPSSTMSHWVDDDSIHTRRTAAASTSKPASRSTAESASSPSSTSSDEDKPAARPDTPMPTTVKLDDDEPWER